jgi:hypothetical protein
MDPVNADTPDTSADAASRDEAGRYRPGASGNPRGRPPGSRGAQHLARALAAAGVVAVVMLDPRQIPARRRGVPGVRRLAT